MTQPVKRRYNAAGRRAAAARRRGAIIEAATRLFLTRGYPDTTMAAVAGEAGVSVETVYAVIGTKPELFRLLTETAISGTGESVPVLQRDYIQALQAEPSGRGKLEIYAAAITRIQQRMAPLYLAARQAAAAEPTLAEVWQQLLDRRARNMPLLIEHLESAGALRAGISRQEAADTVWAVNSTEVYQLMTDVRGWSPQQYQDWLTETLCRLLLPDGGLHSAGRPGVPFSPLTFMLSLLEYRYRKRSRVTVTGLFHTGVAVADLDYSLWFYRDLLGFEVIRDRSLGDGQRVVFLSIPGTAVQFELFHTPATGNEPASAPFGQAGSGHFCLYVEDVRAFLKQLARDYPAAEIADVKTIESGPYAGATVAVLADPSGYHIELFDQAGVSGK